MLKQILVAAAICAISAASHAAQNSLHMPVSAAEVGSGLPTFGNINATYLNPALYTLASNFSGPTAPTSPIQYQSWFDTSTTPTTWRVYDGAQWLAIATVDTSGHVFSIPSLTIGDITLTSVNNHELVFGSGQSIRLPANGVLEFGAQQASFSSDDIDTIVMMNLAANGKSQFVVQPNGTPPAGVWANIAVNRVSGANEEHLNFLSLDTGYQITQIVTGSGAYRNLIFRNVGADTFTLDTNNNVTFQRPAAFGAAAGTVPYSALEVFDYLTVSQLTPGAADRGYRLRTSLPQAWSVNASNVNANFYVYDQTNGKFPLTIAPNTQIATFEGTADATSTTTGTIVDSGGLGVAKSLWVGGTANIAGLSTIGNLKSSTNAGQAVNFAGTTENAALFWNITAASASAQEIGASFFMTSATGAASGNGPNSAWKMAVSMQMHQTAGSGNAYVLNLSGLCDSGVGNFNCSGLEIDMNNNNVDFPEGGAGGAVGVAFSILTASTHPLAAAINIGTVNTGVGNYAFHDVLYVAPNSLTVRDYVVHDSSSAQYSYLSDGTHSAAGFEDSSTTPIGFFSTGTKTTAGFQDGSSAPYAFVQAGTNSAAGFLSAGTTPIGYYSSGTKATAGFEDNSTTSVGFAAIGTYSNAAFSAASGNKICLNGGSDCFWWDGTEITFASQPVQLQTAANGSVATALSSLGPTGSHTTVQEWIKINGTGGAVRYVPGF